LNWLILQSKKIAKTIGFRGKREVIYFSLVCLLVVFCTNFTHISAWIKTEKEAYFLGHGSFVNQYDINHYIASINQGQRGYWLYDEWHTPEPVEKQFLNFPYILLGHLSRLIQVDSRTAYHIGRLLALPFLLLGLYALLCVFIDNVKKRKIYYLFLTFPIGLSFLFIPAGLWTMEYFVPESNVFMSMICAPHFIAGLAVLTWVVWLYLKNQKKGKNIHKYLIILLLTILSITYPFLLVNILGTCLLYVFFDWLGQRKKTLADLGNRLYHNCFIILPSILLILYYALITFSFKTNYNIWWDQNYGFINLSTFLGGIGIIGIFSLYAFTLIAKGKIKSTPSLTFLVSWFLATIFIFLLPLPFAIRFITGLQIPLVLLALVLFDQASAKTKKILFFLVVVLVINTLFFLTFETQSKQIYSTAYLNASEYEVLTWLKEKEPEPQVVLSFFDIGNYLPAVAQQKSVYGHNIQTINKDKKNEDIHDFFSTPAPNYIHANILEKYNVKYIYWGLKEQDESGLNPQQLPFVSLVYSADSIELYEVHIDNIYHDNQEKINEGN